MLVFAGVISCEGIEPIDENRLDFEFVGSNPGAAEGILLNGYTGILNQYSFSEAGTDDAVNNQMNNGYKRMALGELNALYNPAARWSSYERVFWVNKFLEIIDAGEIQWNRDETINEMFYIRMKGEALALRALHHFYVFQAHAGVGQGGDLLGIPYFTEFVESNGDFNLPRLTFEETITAIMKDFDDALALLPTDYGLDAGNVDPWYTGLDGYDYGKYIVANGSQYDLRLTGKIVKGLKARVELFVASPAFLNSQDHYTMAANIASELLNDIGGVAGLEPDGVEFYNDDDDHLRGEMLWRGSIGGNSSNYESRMFPPSVNGKGEINPSHNFVMAFPMLDGNPATEANGFDPQNPYANRDPRLAKYVVVNGDTYGGGTINTGFGGGIDRLDSIPQFSTTTGYYLKKLLRPDVRINSDGTTTGKSHFNVYFRYTELFLILAEAANEVNGPDHAVNGISARDVIAAIRERAGITQPDAFLASVTTIDAMRDLIRNERRLELSFEGHRFWDLRRWDADLNVTAEGYYYDGTSYISLPSIEERNYPDYGEYMPIPNGEIIKFSALEQNQGW